MRHILLIFISLTLLTSSNAQKDTCLHNLTPGISFPPVGTEEQRAFTKKHLDSPGVKKIRFAEDWALRELIPGNFNRKPLDARINWACDNGYEILLTIQSNASDPACSKEITCPPDLIL